MNNYKVGIAGFRGYSGAELIRLLARHPHVQPILLEHRQESEQRPQPINSKQAATLPCTAEAIQAAVRIAAVVHAVAARTIPGRRR